jgi:dsDNA-specific endonuclease/ATPase MutS2
MSNEELSKLLQKLLDEIKNTRAVDEKGTELLRDLDEDIHALLERSEDTPEPLNQTSVQRLQDAVYHFEATHSSLTVLISKLLESLSNAGI